MSSMQATQMRDPMHDVRQHAARITDTTGASHNAEALHRDEHAQLQSPPITD